MNENRMNDSLTLTLKSNESNLEKSLFMNNG